MQNLLRINYITMGILALLGFSGCEHTKPFYTGTFNGEPYELLSVETKGFSTNSIDYSLKLGELKPVKIDPLTTDWGPPYADDLYGSARRVYIPTKYTPYRNERDNPQRHPSTMLYLSPKRFSEKDFDRYAAFLKSEWPTIDRQFSRDDYDRFPEIIGIVYGEQQDFARIFVGRKEGQKYTITIEPDGRIRYMPADTDWPNDEYSGLSEKVQMPGKVIYVATGREAMLTPAQLQTYRDDAGKTLSDYFRLEEKPSLNAEKAP